MKKAKRKPGHSDFWDTVHDIKQMTQPLMKKGTHSFKDHSQKRRKVRIDVKVGKRDQNAAPDAE